MLPRFRRREISMASPNIRELNTAANDATKTIVEPPSPSPIAVVLKSMLFTANEPYRLDEVSGFNAASKNFFLELSYTIKIHLVVFAYPA